MDNRFTPFERVPLPPRKFENLLGLALKTREARPDFDTLPPLVFLACPYTHPSLTERAMRVSRANMAAALLMENGYAVFSPISHGDAIGGCSTRLDPRFEGWTGINDRVLTLCDAVAVLDLDGMWESRGVAHEVGVAAELGLPVNICTFLDGGMAVEPDSSPDLWTPDPERERGWS